MQPTIAIQAEGVKKSFKDVKALKGVDLVLLKGTILALLGPNGAGKTTLVRILTTLLTPDEGQIQILGRDIVQKAQEVRKLIGLSGQNASVDENLTGRENLKLVGQLYHLPKSEVKARTEELIAILEMDEYADRRVKTYSSGMRRRVDLALALIGHPEVLFLDEPTTGLDPKSRQALWQIIEKLAKEGTSILLTTQYLEEADKLADWIVVLDQGNVIAQGGSRELKSRVGGDVLELHLAEPRLTVRAATSLVHLGTDKPQIDEDSGKISLPVAGAHVLSEVVRRLDTEKIAILDLALHRPTLDDVFLSLTGHAAKAEQGGL